MSNDKKISNLENELYDLRKKVDFIADKLGFEEEDYLLVKKQSALGLRPYCWPTYIKPKLTKWDKLLEFLGIEWKDETKTIQEFKN